jgi:peroxiredoxin
MKGATRRGGLAERRQQEEHSMAIQVGDRIPDVKLRAATGENVRELSTAALCRGRRVVLFAVPGAFTSTCSEEHMPGFVVHADSFRERGVDLLACTAVNDVEVLIAWGSQQGVGDKIVLLADGNGEFACAMGLELDGRPFGLGIRSQRYAAIIDDGVVRALHVDPIGEVQASGAEAILAEL